MALSSASLFLYGITITTDNQNITYVNSSGTFTVQVTIGTYSLTNLGLAIVAALQSVDPINTYSYSVNRSIAGGTANRFTLTSTDSVFSLLFSSGSPSNPASLLGFTVSDFTGSLTYTGSSTCGTALIPNQLAYTFLPTQNKVKNQGVRNISASGIKETITFSIMYFLQAQYKYIPGQTFVSEWSPFIQWAIQQNPFEYTPQVSDPSTVFNVTLDDPNQGLSFDAPEMLPDYPNYYQTPLMVFRVINS